MKYKPPKLMTFSKDEPITVEVVNKFMEKHKLEVARYEYLKNMYLGIMDESSPIWRTKVSIFANLFFLAKFYTF